MNCKYSLVAFVITLTVALLLSVGNVIAQEQGPQSPQSAIGTSFTYQGQLKNTSGPVNGNCDFEFSLWDSADNTTGQISTTLALNNVAVSGGLFTVALDFGASAFTGEARWLQIAVKCGSDPTFTPLTPRQPLTPVPYALALPGLRTQQNATSPNVIGGYRDNAVGQGVYGAVIVGGGANGAINSVSAGYATVSGGAGNIANGIGAFVGGGGYNGTTFAGNQALGNASMIGGGYKNAITTTASYASIVGGESNTANIDHAAIGGGGFNTARGAYSTIGGGGSNTTGDFLATIGGGNHNTASGLASTVPGGDSNIAQGNYAFAAGRQAQANHGGTFVWADAIGAPFTSTGANQFNVRATGGVSLSVGGANARVNGVPLLPRALAPTTNTTTTLDSAGDVGQYTSLTIGADGLGLISYYDATNHVLKVAHCNNVVCSSASALTLDNVGSIISGTAIVVGADGLGLISYYDALHGALKVAHCSNTTCTSATAATLDSVSDVGAYSSITIGADGLGLISYYDIAYQDLKIAHCNDPACTSAAITTLDSTGNVGIATSLAIGADGLGLISYYDYTNSSLKVAHCNNATCSTASIATIAAASPSPLPSSSIALGADGLGLISHYLTGPSKGLMVAHCSNPICSSAIITRGADSMMSSATTGLDGLGLISHYGPGGDLTVMHCSDAVCTSATMIVLDSIGNVGRFPSATIGADGLPLIAYYDVSNGDLKVAHCANSFCVPYFRRR